MNKRKSQAQKTQKNQLKEMHKQTMQETLFRKMRNVMIIARTETSC